MATLDIEDLDAIQTRVTAAINAYDPPTRTEATADKQELLAAISATALLTRLGPDFNPQTQTITLIAGDDYLASNHNALTFAITLPGIDLSEATVVYGAAGDYLPQIAGSATLIDINTDTPKLRLQWTRAQTRDKAPSSKYSWGVAIIVGNEVQTVIGGPLHLRPPLVPLDVVDEELTS